MDKVFRQYIGKSTYNEQDGTIKAVISTNSPNRYDEIVNSKGARLDNYRKNPVVLFNHNSNIPPIGKNINIAVYENEIVALTKFANTQLAKDIETLYKDGFMNAFSIGFIPNKVDTNERGQIVYNDWEMLEYSCVPIPANPEAISMALKSVQSPEIKTFLNEYREMQNKEDKYNELETKINEIKAQVEMINEIKAQVEMLALSYDNIFNSAEFVDGYQDKVQVLSDEVKSIKEILNNKVKSYDKAILKSLIKDLVSNEISKIVKKVK